VVLFFNGHCQQHNNDYADNPTVMLFEVEPNGFRRSGRPVAL
jgi:hypothetical protein